MKLTTIYWVLALATLFATMLQIFSYFSQLQSQRKQDALNASITEKLNS